MDGMQYKTNAPFEGKANYTFGILFRKLTVEDLSTHEKYTLKQTNILAQILTLPIRIIVPSSIDFKLFKDDICIGETFGVSAPGDIKINISNDEYTIYSHSARAFSIMKKDDQVALIQRERAQSVARKYNIDVDASNVQPIIVFLMALLVDAIYYCNRYNRGLQLFPLYPPISPKSEFYERTKWKSTDHNEDKK